MDVDTVRARAEAFCAALVAGDVERATDDMSNELRQHLGEVVAMLPLPTTQATVVSVEHGGSGYNAIVRLLGETDEVEIQTRWKDRDGRPTLVEASHLSKTARAANAAEEEAEGEPDAAQG